MGKFTVEYCIRDILQSSNNLNIFRNKDTTGLTDTGNGPTVPIAATLRPSVPTNGTVSIDDYIPSRAQFIGKSFWLDGQAMAAFQKLRSAVLAETKIDILVHAGGGRTSRQQAELKTSAAKAKVGHSMHEAGIAIDFSTAVLNKVAIAYGSRIMLEKRFDAFGWDNPAWAKVSKPVPETWHFEYAPTRDKFDNHGDAVAAFKASGKDVSTKWKTSKYENIIRKYFQGYEAVAYAVMMAESSGIPEASNHNSNGTVDIGLWQINEVHFENVPGKTRAAKIAWLMVPDNNARQAAIISGAGKNWNPWRAFTSGTYRNYL